MAVPYLEIITDDVDTRLGLYQHVHGLFFAPPDPDPGQAPRGDSVRRNRSRHPEAGGYARASDNAYVP